jgi:hypothetical protein
MEKFTAGPKFPRLGKMASRVRYAGALLKLQIAEEKREVFRGTF